MVENHTHNQFDISGLNTTIAGIISSLSATSSAVSGVNASKLPLAGGTMVDGANIAIGSTTGTQIGTATTQKLGHYGSTPVVQPGTGIDLSSILQNLGLRASSTTFGRREGVGVISGATTLVWQSTTGSASNILADATSAAFTITLPTITTPGVIYLIKKSDATANAVTVKAGTAGTIDSVNTLALGAQDFYIAVMSTTVADSWNYIGGTFPPPRRVSPNTLDLASVLSNLGLRSPGNAFVDRMGVATPTATGTLTTSSAGVQYVDDTSGSVILTLPTVTVAGYRFLIKKINASGNTVTVKAGTAGTIDGVNTVVIAGQFDYIEVTSTGTSDVWRITGGLKIPSTLVQGATTDLATVLNLLGFRAGGNAFASRIGLATVSATATLTTGSAGVQLTDATSGAVVLTLPSTTTPGYQFTIKKTDLSTNTVTVKAGTSGTIDGTNTIVLVARDEYVTVVSTSVSDAWQIIARTSKRSPVWQPSDNQLIAASFDPQMSAPGLPTVTNVVWISQVFVPAGRTITNVVQFATGAGATFTFAAVGIYEANGSQSGVSASAGTITAYSTTGQKVIPLITPVSASALDRFVWIGFQVEATTQPTFTYQNVYGNTGIVSGPQRSGIIASGSTTTLPSSINLAIITPYYAIWGGIS